MGLKTPNLATQMPQDRSRKREREGARPKQEDVTQDKHERLMSALDRTDNPRSDSQNKNKNGVKNYFIKS
jgi:hypothetical protein